MLSDVREVAMTSAPSGRSIAEAARTQRKMRPIVVTGSEVSKERSESETIAMSVKEAVFCMFVRQWSKRVIVQGAGPRGD